MKGVVPKACKCSCRSVSSIALEQREGTIKVRNDMCRWHLLNLSIELRNRGCLDTFQTVVNKREVRGAILDRLEKSERGKKKPSVSVLQNRIQYEYAYNL